MEHLPEKYQSLFEQIIAGLQGPGYCVIENALPPEVAEQLLLKSQSLSPESYIAAGIGRASEHTENSEIRRDDVVWLDESDEDIARWTEFMDLLRAYLNRRLFLGLFSFESHLAKYASGAFYKKHKDAFHGQSNRILSVVTYLNKEWPKDCGGELVLYDESTDQELKRVSPNLGTMVIFLSEEVPHEVRPAKCERLSVAGWFRLNATTKTTLDPPR